MKISMRGNAILLDAFDYANELEGATNGSRPEILKRALEYVDRTSVDFLSAQKYKKMKAYDRDIITQNISVEILDEDLFKRVKKRMQENFPGTRLQYPFIVRIVLTLYIMSMAKDVCVQENKKANRNTNLKWALENNFDVDSRIIEETDLRGVYGFFVGDECLYVGRSTSIYGRLFRNECHILNLRNGLHVPKLVNSVKNKEKIYIRLIEEVNYIDEFCVAKNAQRLASRECYWIDYYQDLDMCLEQFPEGRWY